MMRRLHKVNVYVVHFYLLKGKNMLIVELKAIQKINKYRYIFNVPLHRYNLKAHTNKFIKIELL